MAFRFNPFTGNFDLVNSGSGSGDMTKAVYDPANINEQLVGLLASQVLRNKTFEHLTVKPTFGGGSASLFLNNDAGGVWEFFANNGGSFGVYEQTNSKQPFTIDPNTATDTIKLSPAGSAFKGTVTFNNLIIPQMATTAGAPAYVKGAIYFDTTLNKLRVGGATAWETISSS